MNVRKLGLTDEETPTRELDALFDSLDLDGSGAIDTPEARAAWPGAARSRTRGEATLARRIRSSNPLMHGEAARAHRERPRRA